MAVTRVFLINLYVTLFFACFAVSNGQNQMTEGENSSRTGPQHEDKQAQSAFPGQRVDAVEGASAFLTCLVDNRPDVETSTVECSKDGVQGLVHLYKHRKDQVDDQAEEFRGRTTLYHEGLKRGNVTVELHHVDLSDSGQYICYIPSLDYRCYITLNIDPNRQNNMTKGQNSSTTGPSDEDNQGDSGRLNRNHGRTIVLSIIFSIFLIVIIILIVLARRHDARKSKMKRTDEENG